MNNENSYYQPSLSLSLQLVPDWETDFAGYSYTASQADVACFKSLKESPDAAKYPHAARWWEHIASYEADFTTLPGDTSKPYSAYGPDVVAAEEEDDTVDLFASDEEEEDAEAARIREQRLATYKAKKAAKPKAAAKSVVIMDVKPWGAYYRDLLCSIPFICSILTPSPYR